MDSSRPADSRSVTSERMLDGANSNLDVDWLLQSKKELTSHAKASSRATNEPSTRPRAEHTPPDSPTERIHASAAVTKPSTSAAIPSIAKRNATSTAPAPPQANTSTAPVAPQPNGQRPIRPSMDGRSDTEENTNANKTAPNSSKKEKGRKSSWLSSIGSKFSSSSPGRTSGPDPSNATTASPVTTPKIERSDPMEKQAAIAAINDQQKSQKMVVTPAKRASVLVPAGKEMQVEHPGFLGALRRLSSSSGVSLGRGAEKGAICPRKIMNVDQNRDRIRISEFDQNKLRRVAFCVDVEIAGYASQADEDPASNVVVPGPATGQKQGIESTTTKDANKAKYKDKGEGAALKKPETAAEEKAEFGQTKADAAHSFKAAIESKQASNEEDSKDNDVPQNELDDDTKVQAQPSRKKEKKKRSEAERKERREKKRKQAEANGLVPLELTRDDSDSSSSPNSTPNGTHTPKRPGDAPTTDPLRIYKRCCQLRETTPLEHVKEQIARPAAVLAEAPGTVGVIDLSGLEMSLQDISTLGDWLAVVPVRKLVLNNCNLSDEGLRIVLSGLAGCKSAEQARQNRKLPKPRSGQRGLEQLGIIERLSLQNNSGITSLGWKHIALFLHLSKSLKAIDLSGIPFPGDSDLSRQNTLSSTGPTFATPSPQPGNLGTLVIRAIAERLGNRFEEMIMTGCGLTTVLLSDLIDCAIKRNIRRLGLASNQLNEESISHVARYLKSGICEGVDLGGNDLRGKAQLIAEAAGSDQQLYALGLSDCNLTVDDLKALLKHLGKLQNFKFIDLSRNSDLFRGPLNGVSVFRKLLPSMASLKRIHLANTGMTSEHVVALAEIFPDCEGLAHINLLENERLVETMNSTDESSQEEACAFLAALMTAVRVSSIIAIEIEVPSHESSEVVRALSSQIVGYCLRNMETGALDEFGVNRANLPDKDAPEVLLHLVGHMDGYSENHDNDEPAPDEDYVIASTGIVKALGVCLTEKEMQSRSQSRNISPTASGPATPIQGPLRPTSHKKPRNVSLELCSAARKIRMRLRPALVREDKAGNDMNYRRLLMLDQTLQRMIQRFEDEYPETKIPHPPFSLSGEFLSPATAQSQSLRKSSIESAEIPSIYDNNADEETLSHSYEGPSALRTSRAGSSTSLAAMALTNEEGRMHRFGQTLRREVLKPSGIDDYHHQTSSADPPEPEHLQVLRSRLEDFKGEEIRQKVMREGADHVIQELGINVRELAMLRQEDPAGFETFKNSQLAAQMHAGLISSATTV